MLPKQVLSSRIGSAADHQLTNPSKIITLTYTHTCVRMCVVVRDRYLLYSTRAQVYVGGTWSAIVVGITH